MTNAEAAVKLEELVKFYEDNQQHLLLGAARQNLETVQNADPNAETNPAIAHFIEGMSTQSMMDKFDKSKSEDSCDWTANGSNNNFYSMRDVPTAESTKSRFRALCEESIRKLNEDAKDRLTKAVMVSCNTDAEDAWEDILAARQELEDNAATDPDRATEYLQWALDDLGLELDYAEEFINDVPYKKYQADDDDNEEEISLSDFVD